MKQRWRDGGGGLVGGECSVETWPHRRHPWSGRGIWNAGGKQYHTYKHTFKETGYPRTRYLCSHTHTHAGTHSSMIHVIGRMFVLDPARQQEGGGTNAGRSVADHQYTPHLSLQRAFISHSPSLGISHLNVHRRENLWRTIQYKKNSIFRFLTSLFTAGCIATGQRDSCSIADKLKKRC